MLSKVKYVGKKIYSHWLTVAFILGFITDSILLNQIDNVVDNLVLLFYAVLSTSTLLLLYIGVAEKAPLFLTRLLKKYTPILMQYAFGGLLSGMLIFYGRSGDWLASAPFLLLIVSVVIGNELVNKRSDRLLYHLALYFIGLFSYIVLVVPVVTGKMGDWVFVVSGLIALAVVTGVIKLLYRIIPNFMAVNTGRVILTIGAIYVGFNVLYFSSLIPPIPLSLTELEVVQSVSKLADNNYRVETEVQPWYRQIPFVRPVIHPTHGSIACFARVYAPTKLATEIFHRWEYKDDSGQWQERFRLGYNIYGTNKGGYRGYTSLKNFTAGVWRCSVETKRGQVLGRQTVVVDLSGKPKAIEVLIE